MVEVSVREGEQLERALRRFKKKWERAGVLREVKRKSFYIKPSDEKRAAKKKAIRRRARFARMQ
jgi:small subunit ribosomal protein S21